MKLIVAEVVLEMEEAALSFCEVLPRPEGTTWYPDARVFVRTEPNTPRWNGRQRQRRRALANR